MLCADFDSAISTSCISSATAFLRSGLRTAIQTARKGSVMVVWLSAWASAGTLFAELDLEDAGSSLSVA